MKEDSSIFEIRKGLLMIAVLQTVTNKKLYAAEILKKLDKTEFATQEGTLYPMLSRLKRDGYITHDWVESKSGPPRKYYRASPEGKKYIEELTGYIDKIRNELSKLGGNDE